MEIKDGPVTLSENGEIYFVCFTSTVESGQLKFHVSGTVGTTMDIQATTDFINWTVVKTVTVESSGTDVTLPIETTAGERFFRILAREIP